MPQRLAAPPAELCFLFQEKPTVPPPLLEWPTQGLLRDLPETYFKSGSELWHGWDLNLSLPLFHASSTEKHVVFPERVSAFQEVTRAEE